MRKGTLRARFTVCVSILLACCHGRIVPDLPAAEPVTEGNSATAHPTESLIGYTELRTDLPGGRHSNVRTMRAVVIQADGKGRRTVGAELADNSNAWTQFAGWSPDGQEAVVSRGWQNPENAQWEEKHRTFRMDPDQWMLDACLVNLQSGQVKNLTAVDRVSHYNGGLFFLPDGKTLGFTPLIGGKSRPFLMDLDGRNKRDVSGKDAGFAYGYSASPDGKRISYHEDYQIFLSNTAGSNKRRLETGNAFNFGPRWSADGQWLLFVSGVRGKSNPYVVRQDGTGLRKLADLNGYQGWILFLDVEDFHEGSSDVPVWDVEGRSVFYTATTNQSVELFRVWLDGKTEQLTHSKPGELHYHPAPSPDGQSVVYGSKREGVRQLFVRHLATQSERPITKLTAGHAAMWPHWRPVANRYASLPVKPTVPAKALPLPGETFVVDGRPAFLIPAGVTSSITNLPWVWYAPTLPGLPGVEERWMFEHFLKAGIAIAGIDVGESYGNLQGQVGFSKLHEELTVNRRYSRKPILLGRSRGGLMTLSWAVNHPDQVGGFAGIYPVCNLASYPGLKRASSAYQLTEAELAERLAEFNPIDRLAKLAHAGVPLFAIHGDIDKVVPLEANSRVLKQRYESLGGKMELVVASSQDHNMWEGFFQSRELVDFVIRSAAASIR